MKTPLLLVSVDAKKSRRHGLMEDWKREFRIAPENPFQNYLGCAAGWASALAGDRGGIGSPSRTIVTLRRITGVSGLSSASRGTRAIAFTTSTPSGSHWPKSV